MGYGDVFERLNEAGVRFVVVGGTAVALHGHRREARDLDIVVELAPEATRRATGVLLSLGFVPTLPLPLEMLCVLRMLNRDGRSVDVFARFRLPFEELWSASEELTFDGHTIRIVTFDCLIRLKRIAGRPSDAQDIEELLKGRSSRR